MCWHELGLASQFWEMQQASSSGNREALGTGSGGHADGLFPHASPSMCSLHTEFSSGLSTGGTLMPERPLLPYSDQLEGHFHESLPDPQTPPSAPPLTFQTTAPLQFLN